jgi:2-polyprenyl-3-methyl-5-hydroxy-6-metoxy-1,4-benzoquinol methylase
MTSTLSAQIWYPWPLILDREKNISDRDVIKKIIRMTIPKKTVCKLLDVGCSNSGRLQEAVSHNALVEGTGLMQKTICHTDKKNTFKKNQKIELIPTELLQYRAAPSFDLIYLFEWLARIPADKQKSILQNAVKAWRSPGDGSRQ